MQDSTTASAEVMQLKIQLLEAEKAKMQADAQLAQNRGGLSHFMQGVSSATAGAFAGVSTASAGALFGADAPASNKRQRTSDDDK